MYLHTRAHFEKCRCASDFACTGRVRGPVSICTSLRITWAQVRRNKFKPLCSTCACTATHECILPGICTTVVCGSVSFGLQHVTHCIASCLLRCLKKVVGLAMSGASLLDSKAAFKGKVLEYGLPLPVFEGIVRRGVDTLSKAAYAVGAPGVLPTEDALRSFLNPDEPATVEQGQVAIARRLVFEAQTLAVSQLRQQIEGPDEKRHATCREALQAYRASTSIARHVFARTSRVFFQLLHHRHPYAGR